MTDFIIDYNPYLVTCTFYKNGRKIGDKTKIGSKANQRLQILLSPSTNWEGLLSEIAKFCNDTQIRITLKGRKIDFEDLLYSVDKYSGEVKFECVLEEGKNEAAIMSELDAIIADIKKKKLPQFEELDSSGRGVFDAYDEAKNGVFEVSVIATMSSGKSTLISCLTGESKYKGSVFFSDDDISLMNSKQRSRLVSLLPQNLPALPITVEKLVEMGRNPYTDIGKRLSEKDAEQIEKAIESTKITDIRHKKLTEISGGERQKAYIAMVLSQNTRVIALDEPTTYMDVQVEKAFMSLICELKEKHKKTILVVMHDLSRAIEIADNVLLLDDGRVKAFGKTQDVLQSGAIEELFGVKQYECEFDGKKKIIFR